jgi:hypothetical protein
MDRQTPGNRTLARRFEQSAESFQTQDMWNEIPIPGHLFSYVLSISELVRTDSRVFRRFKGTLYSSRITRHHFL